MTLPSPALAVSPEGAAGSGGIGFADATLDGAESPDTLVARTRKSYDFPFVRYSTANEQHVDTGDGIRCHEPPEGRYSIQ